MTDKPNPFDKAFSGKTLQRLKRIYDPPQRLRYFYSRDVKSGEYHVKDRQLHDMVIAKCFFKEAAALVQTALNESLKPKETQVEQPQSAGPSKCTCPGDGSADFSCPVHGR